MQSLTQQLPRRAAIYVRVSSANQEEGGTSLGTQEAACREHAAGCNCAVNEGNVYRDVHTGTELWERPQLTRLREAIRRREIDVVIVHAIDRLARDPVHLGVILTEADHAGVAVEFVTEPLDNSPEGQLIRFVRGYAAKVEHEEN
jgi:site-specific DNA recombinase